MYTIKTNLFDEIKFDADQVKKTKEDSKAALVRISNNFGFEAEPIITKSVFNGRKRIKDSSLTTYDIIVELKGAAELAGRWYNSRSDIAQIATTEKEEINSIIEVITDPLDSNPITTWFVSNLTRIVAYELLLDFTNVDKKAMDIEVSLKEFQSVLGHVERSSTGDFCYRSNSIAKYGTEADVTIGFTEREKALKLDPKANGYYSNDREIIYTIKIDWHKKVFEQGLRYVNLNNGKIAAVLDADPATHKTQEEDVNLWKLKVAYIKVPKDVYLWRNASKENFEKCVHVEELFYAQDKNDLERFATGTTAGRAIGTLNRRSKKEMFELMGLL